MSRLLQALKNLEARPTKPAAGKGLLAHLADKYHSPSPDPQPAAPHEPVAARPSPLEPQPLDNPLAHLSAAMPTIVLRSPPAPPLVVAPLVAAPPPSPVVEIAAEPLPAALFEPVYVAESLLPEAAEAAEEPSPDRPEAYPTRQPTLLERSIRRTLADPQRCEPFQQLAERFVRDLDQVAGHSVLVTGVGPASETHEVLLHVAAVLAAAGHSILLIDGDAAHRTLTAQLDRAECRGMAEIAAGEVPPDEIASLVQPTAFERLSLLPLGKARLGDLAGGATRVAGVVQTLEESYRLVLIDGARTSELAAATLARLCDATYFVIRLGETEAAQAQQALRDFRAAGARVLGCIATS